MTDLSSRNFEGLEAFAFEPRKVEKPWGYELIWAQAELYCGKILFVREGHALSLQFHKEKDETIYVQSGRVEFTIGEAGDPLPNTEVVSAGCAFRITPGTIHRMRALDDSMLLEVSTPQLDDVVRLDDLYGRTES
jgi:mannose-6-phosphate isomerase-like protein (cupin superfamily)